MSTWKKILLYAGMVIAIIMLVLGAVGIIGAWAYNTPVTETILGILAPITDTLQVAEDISRETGVALDEVSAGLGDAQQQVADIGDELNEANLVVEAISAIVGEDVGPRIEETGNDIRAIYDTIGAIQEVIQSFNNIPFLDAELPGDEALGQVRTGMEDLTSQVQDLIDTLQQRKMEIVDGAVEQVSQPLINIDAAVVENREKIGDIELRIKTSKEDLLVVAEKVPGWIDMISIIITLVLIWFIISQIAVFVLCRKYLRSEA